MKSTNLIKIEQLELPMSRRATKSTVDQAVIAAQSSMTSAINLCISISGLDDKEVCRTLSIDAGHWSRIRKGEAHFPIDKLDDLINLCGNEIPLQWWALKRGYELKPIRSALERQLLEKDIEIEQLRAELSTLAKYGIIKQS